jgi:hypothetical protein
VKLVKLINRHRKFTPENISLKVDKFHQFHMAASKFQAQFYKVSQVSHACQQI